MTSTFAVSSVVHTFDIPILSACVHLFAHEQLCEQHLFGTPALNQHNLPHTFIRSFLKPPKGLDDVTTVTRANVPVSLSFVGVNFEYRVSAIRHDSNPSTMSTKLNNSAVAISN